MILFIILSIMVLYTVIFAIWMCSPISEHYERWQRYVKSKDVPLYSLRAFYFVGGRLDDDFVPYVGKYRVTLSFRDWHELYIKKKRETAWQENDEREEKILATRIAIANQKRDEATD